MKYLLFLLTAFHKPVTDPELVNLKITVTNIKVIKGDIQLGIFNTKDWFLHPGKEYRTYTKNVTSDSVVFTLTGLVKDSYAISIYHDINSDSKCNLNFLGIPTEPYGFSKNYRPIFSKPSFNDCRFDMNNHRAIIIKLIHWFTLI